MKAWILAVVMVGALGVGPATQSTTKPTTGPAAIPEDVQRYYRLGQARWEKALIEARDQADAIRAQYRDAQKRQYGNAQAKRENLQLILSSLDAAEANKKEIERARGTFGPEGIENRLGAVGKAEGFQAVSVVDDSTTIVRMYVEGVDFHNGIMSSKTSLTNREYVLVGIPTAGVVDGADLPFKESIKITGTRKIGGRTVFVIEPLGAEKWLPQR